MGAPDWWRRRRFGLMFQANLATVPAWAPIGEDAAWYHAHLDGTARDVLLHPSPLAETVAHHRLRWAHVEHHDDFAPFLTFDEFDPDEWTALARDAGMGYLIAVAKHHDGVCWWDAPGTERTTLGLGPRRNVIGELAAACERADVVFGTSYSLLDWSDERYPSCEYVDRVVHPHVLDLVERYGSRLLWGDGHWGAGADHWRGDQVRRRARALDPEVLLNDRWWLEDDCVRSYDVRVPAGIADAPFEVRRALGASIGHNRNERDEHLATAGEVVALLTEAVAKGGHLLLAVGADAQGRVPELHAERLRAVGGWVRRHADLVAGGEPWHTWGDDECRYLVHDEVLHVVDVGGRGRFAALTPQHGTVRAVSTLDGAAIGFAQQPDGVRLDRQPRRASRLPAVYRLEIDEPLPAPIALFTDHDPDAIELAPLLAEARPGAIVQLGDGRYVGPARVPDGVTVRGLGPDRTTIDGVESCAVTLGPKARLEHCTLTGGGAERIVWLPKVVVEVPGRGASVIGCRVDGHVRVTGADVRVRSCRLTGLVADKAEAIDVARCTLRGMHWDCAVDVDGGGGHVIEGCEFDDVLQAIRLTGTVGAQIRGNRIRARWWGVHLVDTEATLAVGNSVAGAMRAFDVDGGTLATITGNAVGDGDSGCVVQRGASDCEVSGNRWERCRAGLFRWDAGDVRHHGNDVVDLLDPDAASVVGP